MSDLDTPGLDAAIEAAAWAMHSVTCTVGPDCRHLITHASAKAWALAEAEPVVRAAAPHIRAAALNEAADDIGKRMAQARQRRDAMHPTDEIRELVTLRINVLQEERTLLRDRAGREVGGE